MCGILVYFEYCYDVCAVFWCFLILLRCKCGVLVYFGYCYDVNAVFLCILDTVTMYVRCSGVF